jgi:hypothetical protein
MPSLTCPCLLTVTIPFCISFAPLPFPLARAGHQHSYYVCVWTKQNIHCHHIFVLIDRNCDWWQADRSDCHCFLSVPRVREHDTQIIHPLQWCGPARPLSDLFCYPVTWKAVGAGWDVLTPTRLWLFTNDRFVCKLNTFAVTKLYSFLLSQNRHT